MNDKAPQVTNLKDAQTFINQLWEVTRVQPKTIDNLTQQVSSLTQQVDSLTFEVNTLKEKLSKNSNNSSKPPSSDGYSKPLKVYVQNQENRLAVNEVTKAKP